MNKVNIDENEEKVIYSSDCEVEYNVPRNGKLIVFHYSYDCSNLIIVNLNGENAKVEYHYSSININNNTAHITINHLADHTESFIYNHGVNKDNNSLQFFVTGNIPKSSNKCICNQENQIINLANGKSEINPNLLIENYDCVSSHAAYIGKFKEDIIFYLMSRGINRELAINILIKNLLLNGGDNENSLVKDFLKHLEKRDERMIENG